MDYTCRSYRTNFKYIVRTKSKEIQFKQSYCSVKFLIFLVAKFKETSPKIFSLSLFKLSFNKLNYQRDRKRYKCLSFKNSFNKSIVLIPYVSRDIVQDKDHWIIDKSDLAKVGLNPHEMNSLAEIVTSLILYWSDGDLDSSRINIVFYRHIVFEEDGSFFDAQAFLINLLNTHPSSRFSPEYYG